MPIIESFFIQLQSNFSEFVVNKYADKIIAFRLKSHVVNASGQFMRKCLQTITETILQGSATVKVQLKVGATDSALLLTAVKLAQ